MNGSEIDNEGFVGAISEDLTPVYLKLYKSGYINVDINIFTDDSGQEFYILKSRSGGYYRTDRRRRQRCLLWISRFHVLRGG